MNDEGYVKYSALHSPAPPFKPQGWETLNDIRTGLHDLCLVGVHPDGIGFGNISLRVAGKEFLISGTATGAKRVLTPDEYCLVTAMDIAGNKVWSRGPVRASSESMTHGAVYEACPGVGCVIHIHSRAIFDGMIRDKSPSTPRDVLNGTPEIAGAVIACVTGRTEGVIVLAGHDEGVLSYGPSPEKAFDLIKELYKKYSGV